MRVPQAVCFAVGGQIVDDENRVKEYLPAESVAYLEAGVQPLELRYFRKSGEPRLQVRWKPPAARIWEAIPNGVLRGASPRRGEAASPGS